MTLAAMLIEKAAQKIIERGQPRVLRAPPAARARRVVRDALELRAVGQHIFQARSVEPWPIETVLTVWEL